MLYFVRTLYIACLTLAATCAWSASATSYSMEITVGTPKGSAAEKLEDGLPASTTYTPCQDSTALDALSFQLEYSGGDTVEEMLDVYIFFFNPSGDGETVPRFIMVSRPGLNTGGTIATPRLTLNDIDPEQDRYQPSESNLGGSISETLIGSYLVVDGIPLGTWQLVGIVADMTRVDFGDASTWNAWDVTTVVLGQPWTGDSKEICQ